MVDARHPEVIVDLDTPPVPQPEPDAAARLRIGWRRLRTARLPIGVVVVTALVGAVAGGAAVHRWEVRQQRDADAATVSVSAQLLDSGAINGSGDGVSASMVANLTLVNLGPLPIWVEEVEATRGGLQFRNTAPEAMLRPGFRTVAVWLTLDCKTGSIASDPLTVHLRIRTSDGTVRLYDTTVDVGGARWPRWLEDLCANPPPG